MARKTYTWYFDQNFEITLSQEQASSGNHVGNCDREIDALLRDPAVASQFNTIDPDAIRRELDDYGAWDDKQLQDDRQNIRRILWIACGDIDDYFDNQ